MSLLHCHFFSHALGMQVSLDVLLPEPPAFSSLPTPESTPPYRTLYLLHGRSDDHSIWQRRTSIERYVEGRNLAVVMPAVARSFYADMHSGERYWTFVSHEVPYWARHNFPLSAARADNFVAGLSMGGYGAFKLALNQPEHFSAAASLSGALDAVRLMKMGLANGEQELKSTFGSMQALRGSESDLFALASKLAERKERLPRLYQACGRQDFLYQDNLRFQKHLAKLGIASTYHESDGEHEWGYWDREIQLVLEWLLAS